MFLEFLGFTNKSRGPEGEPVEQFDSAEIKADQLPGWTGDSESAPPLAASEGLAAEGSVTADASGSTPAVEVVPAPSLAPEVVKPDAVADAADSVPLALEPTPVPTPSPTEPTPNMPAPTEPTPTPSFEAAMLPDAKPTPVDPVSPEAQPVSYANTEELAEVEPLTKGSGVSRPLIDRLRAKLEAQRSTE